MQIADFLGRLVWLDGRPLWPTVEPYRRRLFSRFDERDEAGRLRFNLGLDGRSKKNWKTTDLILRALHACVSEPVAGHDNEVYLLANDKDQAGDDLGLAKKIIGTNPFLDSWLVIRKDIIERRDGRGFIQILPANDSTGSHGKTFRLCMYDEVHGYRTWDIFEAMQPDPHRLDAQQWITSYASIYHRPGVPLFDLVAAGRRGDDPRMLFSWYAADFTTDPDFADLPPERRANPSMDSWPDAGYLAQQQRRLPAHKFRRLHLNLPGVPEGSAFQPEPVMEAIDRGVSVRKPEPGIGYVAFVDMSGGSSDDAVLAVAHRDSAGRAVLDLLMDQGARAPFDPSAAVKRFVKALGPYRVRRVVGDAYAGQTFRAQFVAGGLEYEVSALSKSELYESFEPMLNGRSASLLDVPVLEQQLLGLVWRGGRIDHPSGEHDDFANAAVGVLSQIGQVARCTSPLCTTRDCNGVGPWLMNDAVGRLWTWQHDPANVAAFEAERDRLARAMAVAEARGRDLLAEIEGASESDIQRIVDELLTAEAVV